MSHYEGGTTHCILTPLGILTPRAQTPAPLAHSYHSTVCLQARALGGWAQCVEDTRRRSLCRLRDAEVIDPYTAEYCRENCSAVLGEHPQSRVCFRPPKVSGLLLWAGEEKYRFMVRELSRRSFGKSCRDLTRPPMDAVRSRGANAGGAIM